MEASESAPMKERTLEESGKSPTPSHELSELGLSSRMVSRFMYEMRQMDRSLDTMNERQLGSLRHTSAHLSAIP